MRRIANVELITAVLIDAQIAAVFAIDLISIANLYMKQNTETNNL